MATEIAVPKQDDPNPMKMLAFAVQSGDLEKVNVMMDFVERWEINQDKKLFREAMVRFKANAPNIEKDSHVEYKTDKGKTDYWHASLGNVTQAIGKGLAEVGISHGWTTKQEGGIISVTCTLNYGLYSESATLTAGPDTSGGKNAIQAVISTKSYLERHTLTGITGMATNDQDDDGRGGRDIEHERVVAEAVAIIEASETLDDTQSNFARYFGIAEKQGDKEAMLQYTAARDRRKIALETVENQRFVAAFAECDTLTAFNASIVPLMKEQPRLKVAAVIEAKRRGYKADKSTGLFVASEVTK